MNDPCSASAQRLGPKGQDDLYALVYLSTAARQVSLNELMPVVDAARRRNQQEGITGVLLYTDRRFMQYLEGPAGGLSRVYDIIKAHPLHYGLIDLVREPVAVRTFADWSMAFHLVGAFGRASPSEQDAALSRRLAGPSRGTSRALELLARFWADGRNSVAAALQHHNVESSRRRAWRDLDTGTHD